MKDLKNWIKKCEGYQPHPYLDSVGKITIGWGRNIDDNGISPEEADFMLDNDIARARKELSSYTWFLTQSENVQAALINMNFNLGIKRLLSFRKMILALIDKDFTKAAQEALHSKWAEQVGQRAKDVAVMIRQG